VLDDPNSLLLRRLNRQPSIPRRKLSRLPFREIIFINVSSCLKKVNPEVFALLEYYSTLIGI
jgi:hypothetical protein